VLGVPFWGSGDSLHILCAERRRHDLAEIWAVLLIPHDKRVKKRMMMTVT
jgi:hypothetical protein